MPVTATAAISPAAARACDGGERGGQLGDAERAERRRLGVVEAVVDGDERQRAGAAGQRDVAGDGVGDALGARFGRRAHLAVPSRGLVVGVVRVLPDDGAALAQAHAHRGQAEADVRVLLELAGQLRHQAHAGRGQRVTDGDRAAVLVDAGVVVGDAERVEERQHLDGERLVDLEQADVLDGQARAARAP